jgi:CHAT domain-containing protein/tetratricopeptide (TPR) repeat protein
MDQAELVSSLIVAGPAEQSTLLAQHAAHVGVELAQALKAIYLDTYSSDPQRAAGAAAALSALASANDHPEILALAAWTSGMAELQLKGQVERAIERIDEAAARFEAIGQRHNAASTQVSKIFALARLGRYDEAIACGLRAQEVFLSVDDTLAAGKIDINLGNIYHRRDQYTEAEQCYVAARARFAAIDDQRFLTYADNGLANVLSMQHRFRPAAQLYEQALVRAEATGLEVTCAEIECNLGNLELFQGRYDRALDYLERSRRRYAALDMPHESAISEQELADAYLELNLAPEAAAIYARVIATFAELGMRAEQARALLNNGRACLLLGQLDAARVPLAAAHKLYAEEGNAVGAALVTLATAQLAYAKGDYAAVLRDSARAESPLAEAGMRGRLLVARWLRGEATRALGDWPEAQLLLEATLRDCETYDVPQIAQRCHTSLGLLAAATGDHAAAEAAFKRATVLIEAMRAPLPADEFRTAFAADKLTPYTELTRLCLAEGNPSRIAEALGYVERERSRALVDMLGSAVQLPEQPRDPSEAQMLDRLGELRQELNWFYSQINRPPDGEAPRSAAAMAALQTAVHEREAEVTQIRRQFQQRTLDDATAGRSLLHQVESLDLAQLQHDLGPETALVEYFSLDGELLAFIVTDEQIELIRGLAHEEQIEAALEQFRFQIGALRYSTNQLRGHLDQLASRARHYLGVLYSLLMQPIERRLGARRMIVVPHRALHYIPFHALYDGTSYMIERREVGYAPSATVLRYCHARPRQKLDHAVLVGLADQQTPHVRDELAALTALFPTATLLLDDQATLAALRAQSASADVLHLACHGQFRPDNPLFSSLRLADDWLTVRDAYSLELNCGLVVLSACETGTSAVAPGDELIGLARGFFSAGAPSLVVSLWTVDDASTAALMTSFYTRLRAGDRPAAALRHAQCEILRDHPHPFFWSPFVLLGRW